MAAEHVDVLIVGAGLSGIGAGCHLSMKCPGKSFLLLEARDAIGGTWDLFRYPGIRSDSDMYTLGYAFRPWREARAIASGPSILKYVRETAADYGVDRKIRFGHKVVHAAWSSTDAAWTVEAWRQADGATVRFTCGFLFMCSGYYDYDQGYTPDFAGIDRFQGRLVHPQFWPEELDDQGKQVVVIGSGATAVTLVPAMAHRARHVTMLQRSPTYIVSRPAEDRIANRLRRRLPARLAYALTRWKNVLLGMYFFSLARRKPERVKEAIIAMAKAQLGSGYDVDTHFRPRYNPWDQRLCLVPDADLFAAIRAGKVSVVTDEIASFTETGLVLRSGKELAADIIVTATGLRLKLLGGMTVDVDGSRVDFAKTMSYKGMMFSDVPNLACAFGYTNASWTLKADLTCDYVCRLLRYIDRHGYACGTPRRTDPSVAELPFLDFTSGYVQRAIEQFPRQGSRKPWRLYQNYALDLLTLRFGSIADGAMEFRRRDEVPRRAA
jgi:cation diffusion facilitator CzcD-associated flavoprotein CzcO